MSSRYFVTTNASRPYKAGGSYFSFVPTHQVGGVWSGVLEVENEAASNTLASAGIPQIKEVGFEEFEAAKKKSESYERLVRANARIAETPAAAKPDSACCGNTNRNLKFKT